MKISPTGQVKDLLKTVPLFAACSKREINLLAGIVEVEQFAAGAELCREGEAGLGLFIVMEGETEVKVKGRTRRKLGPGAFFGEIALLDGGPRSATVVASTDVKSMLIPAWSFNATLKSDPSLAITMLKEVCRRVRTSDSSLST
ncbi:MAG TPA: cyclic nucleotide-binding domain-containing protein [Actinomycetota bacterium]|nr:cyclic nucleotide-binding domain-containing protein [Actinomycetota bacterium]